MAVLLEILDVNTGLAVVVVSFSVLWWMSVRRPTGIPPGPGWALPFLGHLLRLKTDRRQQFADWRRQYGDVFSLYLGSHLVVVLNGYDVIKEALVTHGDIFSNRHPLFFYNVVSNSQGVVETSGPVWKAQRKVSVEILRDLRMGKNTLAQRIQEEVKEYVKAISESQGQPVDLTHLTKASVSNIISSIVFGTRFQYDDVVFKKNLKLMDDLIHDMGVGLVVGLLPFLRHLPGDCFKLQSLENNLHLLLNVFIKPFIDDHIDRPDGRSENNFIGAYIREMHRHRDKQSGSAYINDTNLLKVVFDMFFGGSETTPTAILWAVVYFLHHPDVQDKCYEEIHRVVGTERAPTIHDRPGLVYLEATIMEVLRYADIAPFSVPHATACDVKFKGYMLPKDTLIIPNLHSVLTAPEIWGDPDTFRPERFIGEDGALARREEFIPFSLGPRICLGESLARMELFLCLTTMIQHFRFLPPETGELPSLEGVVGATICPRQFKVRAVPRMRDEKNERCVK